VNNQRKKIDLNTLGDMLAYKATEMVRGKEPEYGSITFTFSPASDTINYKVEVNHRIPIKGLTKNN
jgi:hypothetical protein